MSDKNYKYLKTNIVENNYILNNLPFPQQAPRFKRKKRTWDRRREKGIRPHRFVSA